MKKINHFAKHLLSFFAVIFIRMDYATGDDLPMYLPQPKKGTDGDCQFLIGGCTPGVYCTFTVNNVKVDVPLGYKYRDGTLTRLPREGADDDDSYMRGYVVYKSSSSDSPHVCNITQSSKGRAIGQIVTKTERSHYNYEILSESTTYYCVCGFPSKSSSDNIYEPVKYESLDKDGDYHIYESRYDTDVASHQVSDYSSSLSNIAICAMGYHNNGHDHGGGTGVDCFPVPKTQNGTVLSELFWVNGSWTNKSIDGSIKICADGYYYHKEGDCKKCPDNHDVCPVYITTSSQTFTCESGYAKYDDYCVSAPSSGTIIDGKIVCRTGSGSGTTKGQYVYVDSNVTAHCAECPSSAYRCDGTRFYCSGGFFGVQPTYGQGYCKSCGNDAKCPGDGDFGSGLWGNSGVLCSGTSSSGYYKTLPSYDTYECHLCPAHSSCTTGYGIGFYRCDSGYYHNADACTACPSFRGFGSGVTALTGVTSIEMCYIPTGYSVQDSSGYIEFRRDCYYTE